MPPESERSQGPHERSLLIERDARIEITSSPTDPPRLQPTRYGSNSADEEARVSASKPGEADANAKGNTGIAGVISVLLLGTCLDTLPYDYVLMITNPPDSV